MCFSRMLVNLGIFPLLFLLLVFALKFNFNGNFSIRTLLEVLAINTVPPTPIFCILIKLLQIARIRLILEVKFGSDVEV